MRCKASDKPKPKHRKGLWSPEEDQRLRNYVLKYGHGCWSSVPINAGLERNGKSCRLRWINYLRPGLKRGTFTAQEEETVLTLHGLLGNKWSQIALHLPGRTDNEVKNYWHSYLKKRVLKSEGAQQQQLHNKRTTIIPNNPESPHNIPTLTTSKENSPGECSDQTVLEISTNKSPLPKLMFAEWLSLDSFASLSEALVNNKDVGFDHFNYPNFQEIFMNGCYLYNYEIPFGGEYQNSMSGGSAAGDVFKFEGPSSASDQFVDFNSGDDICSDFNVNNVMYT